MTQMIKPLKPAEHAETQLLDSILSGRFPQGSPLPAERVLAESLGVTRPTLRETLQRLSREGWVVIQHGKPTVVADYLETGGLGLLCSMVRHSQGLSHEMIGYLLEVRSAFFPGIAALAVKRDPDGFLKMLLTHPDSCADVSVFSAFDWKLQHCMVTLTGNPVFKVIVNDFAPLYQEIGVTYFKDPLARKTSHDYYRNLTRTVRHDRQSVPDVVRAAMETATAFWKQGA